MRKTLMLMIAALALTTWSVAQDQNNSADQDKDNAAKQDMKKAGHDAKEAAKATGRGVKKGAIATKEKVTGRKDDADDTRRLPNRDDDRDRDRDADHRTAQHTNSGQNPAADTPGERNLPDSINIVGVPSVNPNRNSATITWQTNKNAASDVWLEGAGIRGHRTGYERGGSRNHSVSFSNLKPNTTYNYVIRSRKGQQRYEGSFTTR